MKYTLLLTLLISTPLLAQEKKICGSSDDRVLSYNKHVARAASKNSEMGCTVTLIGRSCAISAGHCVGSLEKASFNVPQSRNRKPQPSQPEDVYYRTKDFLRYKDNGIGDDWAVIRLNPNTITGQYPGDVQGFYSVKLDSINGLKGKKIRITGFGRDSQDAIANFAQQTHTGKVVKTGSIFRKAGFGYDADTMGGNSGSSVVLEETQEIIGVHSHGKCTSTKGQNEGTLISKNKIFKSVIEQCLKWEETL